MNRFEKQVYECMHPTQKLLEKTTDPLHRAILLNFWRHVHLEGAGDYQTILAPDMVVDHPVYRVTWGAKPGVVEGKAGVLGFYNSVGQAVLWHSDDRLAVADWGICDEITFHQLAEGAILKQLGYSIPHAERLYHVASRQAFIWPYDAKRVWPVSIFTKTRPVCTSRRWIGAMPSRRHGCGKSTASSSTSLRHAWARISGCCADVYCPLFATPA